MSKKETVTITRGGLSEIITVNAPTVRDLAQMPILNASIGDWARVVPRVTNLSRDDVAALSMGDLSAIIEKIAKFMI